MPRLRRKAKKRRSLFLSPRTIRRLKTGADFWFIPGDELNAEEFHEAWEEIGEEMTQDWIREKPGTRPYAWWLFEAEEPRRLISGSVTSVTWDPDERFRFTPETDVVPERKFWSNKGCPGLVESERCPGAYDGGEEGNWETQLRYLDRLDLLAPWEKRATLEMARKEWSKRNKMRHDPYPESERPAYEELLRMYDKGSYF